MYNVHAPLELFVHVYVYMYVYPRAFHNISCFNLMRDEKEGRKKQARSSKQQGKATHVNVHVFMCTVQIATKFQEGQTPASVAYT